ncbi:ABC transporter substrate-binding protein [Couchioplanes azureus]|uniref:ABC transporter substrate-binding protein n=1 Tax=Couchioplanes caeruleus TaxID=56438 RepID=UPI001671120B|nr:ABC transporter substrate-binding protein [Couchioplanes caeruleus]GGQ85510.1 alpha-glucoside ABC transporter substrate-binding protein [Couchioplanes caeruleus subsp. azureus]
MRRLWAFLLPLTCALTVTVACGGEDPEPSGASCQPYEAYQGRSGTKVTIEGTIRDVEATTLERVWEAFEQCTGIDISYEGTTDFEATLESRVRAGDGPDIGFFPQPGLIARMARAGLLEPATAEVRANAERWWSADWRRYGTVDGEFYAAPIEGNVKSFVWYSPRLFREKGYAIPASWKELMALTARIAADGVKPWCVGLASGAASGWPATDWLEDVLLRTAGPEVFDQWVTHAIPFDDPRVVAALDRVGAIIRNPAYVNGGHGGVQSIAKTGFQEGGLPVLERKCGMHHQASFYTSWLPPNARVAEDGDVFAFHLPPIDPAHGRPIIGGGNFAGAMTDRPEVDLVTAYMSTPEFANNRARIGKVISANRGFDPANVAEPVLKLSAKLLTDPTVTFRFDGSDLMPSAVGAGTFWSGMIDWINGADTATVLARIEASWPPG